MNSKIIAFKLQDNLKPTNQNTPNYYAQESTNQQHEQVNTHDSNHKQ